MELKQGCLELDAERPKHPVQSSTRLVVAPWAIEVVTPSQTQAELSSQSSETSPQTRARDTHHERSGR
jgi:hypothetical protein